MATEPLSSHRGQGPPNIEETLFHRRDVPLALGQASRSVQLCSISDSHIKQSRPGAALWRAASDQMLCCGDEYGTNLDLLLVLLWSPSQRSLPSGSIKPGCLVRAEPLASEQSAPAGIRAHPHDPPASPRCHRRQMEQARGIRWDSGLSALIAS